MDDNWYLLGRKKLTRILCGTHTFVYDVFGGSSLIYKEGRAGRGKRGGGEEMFMRRFPFDEVEDVVA